MPVMTPRVKADLTARLHRIEGQVRGVERMIEEERECPDVLQQMAAIRSAVRQASLLLARAYLECVLRDREDAVTDEELDQLMATLAKVERD
jgi:CsoR family transcriptional regulator, copper-sensing transcriptional repressor